MDMTTSAQHTQSDRTSWEAEIRQQEQRAKVCALEFITWSISLISGEGCGGTLLERGGCPRRSSEVRSRLEEAFDSESDGSEGKSRCG